MRRSADAGAGLVNASRGDACIIAATATGVGLKAERNPAGNQVGKGSRLITLPMGGKA